MIYSEQDLRIGANAFDIINESAWIDGGSIISPRTIALVESNSVGGYVVRFNDIEALSEEYGIDYIDSMLAIAEVNGIDPQYLAVAVNESDIIINPELVYELANVITVPISRNSTAYQFCEACIDRYMNTGDEGYLELLVEEEKKKEEQKPKDKEADGIIDKIKKTIGGAVAKSADWIARKISALRYMYQEWQEKAYKARAEGKASWFQQVGSRVLQVIDWALSKLQGLLQASKETKQKYDMKAWEGDDRAKDHIGYDTYEKRFKAGEENPFDYIHIQGYKQ